MKKLQNTFVLLLLFISVIAKAQNTCGFNLLNQQLSGNIFDFYYLKYNGNPFFEALWQNATVKLSGGEIIENVKLKYDLCTDNLIYFNDRLKKTILIDKEIVSEFWIKNQDHENPFHIVAVQNSDTLNNKRQFLFMLLNDSISLYMKKNKLLSTYSSALRADMKLGSFIEYDQFFIAQNNEFILVPPNRRKLASLFPEYKDNLIRFMRKNHYSTNNMKHLKSIINEVNNLINK